MNRGAESFLAAQLVRQDDVDVGIVELAQRFDPGEPRHCEIEQQNIRMEAVNQVQSLVSGCRFSNDVEASLCFEQFPQSVAEDRVIVGY